VEGGLDSVVAGKRLGKRGHDTAAGSQQQHDPKSDPARLPKWMAGARFAEICG
jgi:hypothetical protein